MAIKNNMFLKGAGIAGENKYSTGPVEQDCNKANRMDFERFGITEHFSNLAETSDRSFCIISQQEDGHLLHLGPASPSVS